MATVPASAALIGTSAWKLVRVRNAPNGEPCGHCPRVLKTVYDLANTETGEEMTVGRGCCKTVTGWTLTAAEARRLADLAAREAAALVRWGDDYRRALALGEFPNDRAATVCGALVSYMLDGSGERTITRLLPTFPDLLAALGLDGVPLEELEARAAEYRAARLAS
ncbi:hypothetical protein QEH48_gp113 [Streptomyces phage TurkishDelight]|uniref:Uncharacterized protein n=1 Tax=Streptomyces phage TurkishDelight TaxID=2793708 RepID=A0A7T0M1Z3_9CAUD|nr:hypothetical protein QEH48_gp113 [Streptomyces phage TurkishDelight]QPL14142.1 hypothetical protein SEA_TURKISHDELIGHT_113 [Streptomyces phage TurkishDelight]